MYELILHYEGCKAQMTEITHNLCK
jgi:hypothetical protein